MPSLRRGRDALLGAQRLRAALNPALAAVARAEGQSKDPGYPADLAALARIQSELGEHDDAEDNYLEAIDLVEAAEGEFSMTLVEPYRGLGRAYIKAARYPEAITALESAQHVSQRNLGLSTSSRRRSSTTSRPPTSASATRSKRASCSSSASTTPCGASARTTRA